ncbi:MAG: hypothetical protein JW820_11695 [Spirochaetales bacterium]|nr:hypothetical protein [Spirochaetales bacterium]
MKRQPFRSAALRPAVLPAAVLLAAALLGAAGLSACAGTPHPPSAAEGSPPPFAPTPDPPVLFTLLKSGQKPNSNWLDLNEYFPVHYWYADILYRFGLHLRLSLEEKTLILGGLLFNLDFGDPVRLVVDGYGRGRALVVQLQLIEAQPGTAVMLEANVDPRTRRPIPEDKRLFHGYRRLYLLSGSQLLSVSDLPSAERETEHARTGGPAGLGGYYIFDGQADNDGVAERLLLLASGNGQDAAARLRSRLTLVQLYASRGRFAESELALASARLLLQGELAGRQDLWEAFGVVSEELLITRALKELGSRPLELTIPAL